MNMAQETNPGQAPMLCSTGCGFYGNPRTNGMCSVCYKEHLQRQNGSSGTGRISPPIGLRLLNNHTALAQMEELSKDPLCSLMAASPVINLPESSPVKSSDDNLQDSQSTDTPTPAPVQPNITSSQSPVLEPEASSQVEHETDDKIAVEAEDLQASASESAQNSSEELEKSPDKPKLKKKNRCFMCRKKVGLTGFECRCGNVFCGTHRYSDVHSCSYDYKADAAEKIRKENPVVVGEKVQKI